MKDGEPSPRAADAPNKGKTEDKIQKPEKPHIPQKPVPEPAPPQKSAPRKAIPAEAPKPNEFHPGFNISTELKKLKIPIPLSEPLKLPAYKEEVHQTC